MTVNGKCEYKHLFESFGKNQNVFQRALHFDIQDDFINIRHYFILTKDTENNYRVSMREIGPRLTLKLSKIEEGVFSEFGIKKTRYFHKKQK